MPARHRLFHARHPTVPGFFVPANQENNVLHKTKTQEERQAPAIVRQGRRENKEEAGFGSQARQSFQLIHTIKR